MTDFEREGFPPKCRGGGVPYRMKKREVQLEYQSPYLITEPGPEVVGEFLARYLLKSLERPVGVGSG